MKRDRKKHYVILNVVVVAIIAVLLIALLKSEDLTLTSFGKNANGQKTSEEGPSQDLVTDEVEDDTDSKQESEPEETKPEETKPVGQVTEPAEEGEGSRVGENIYDSIIISAAGDVTLGRDESYGYELTMDHELELQNGDFSYIFRNVKDIFEKDDLTIVNLETTLTNATKKADKSFRFKADPSYVEILKQGDVEVVSIANNHTYDFLQQGYDDTIATLKEANVGYFGYEHTYVTDIRGVKVGVIGLTPWQDTEGTRKGIKNAIDNVKEQGVDLVIAMYHWGRERDNYPTTDQRNIAHFSIDNGIDLVLGGHAHVLQGIEEYKGKKIVYSLGNFAFGGNKNPGDKDTMIYIHKFNFKNGELISEDNEIVPCSISSVKDRNNYQPTVLEGEEGQRVLNKIAEFSKPLNK